MLVSLDPPVDRPALDRLHTDCKTRAPILFRSTGSGWLAACVAEI